MGGDYIMLPAIIFLAILPGNFFTYYYLTKAVPVKKPWLFTILLTAILQGFWVINNYVLEVSSVPFDLLSYLVGMVGIGIFVNSAYWLSAVVCYCGFILSQYVVTILMMFLLVPIFNACGISTDALTQLDSYWYALMSLICSLLCWPCMALVAKLGKRWSRPIRISPWLLTNLAVPVSQIALFNISIRLISAPDDFHGYTTALVFGAVCCIAADVVMIYGIYRYLKRRQMQDRMKLLQEQLELQQSYYRQMAENIRQINHIRHDLGNQLQAAYQLLENGHSDHVRAQLDNLRQNLRKKVGPSYCANLMVDAVLSDKARTCQELGIRLDAAVELPKALPIDSSHLCSIFSNLLDNSIKGIQESGTTQPCIDLRASICAGCLSIHCSNPANAQKAKVSHDPLRRHGLGLEILSHLAKEYNGSLQTQLLDGAFQTVMILRLPEQ